MKINVVLILFSFLMINSIASSQCAMCKAVVENGDDQGLASSLNLGILYLMAAPYTLAFLVAYFIYKKIKKEKETQA